MYFVIHALDRADAGTLRAVTRSEHLKYLNRFEVLFGGPLLDEAERMCGSLIVVDLPDRAAVDELVAGDPYFQAGLFAEVTITGLRAGVGSWMSSKD